MELLVIEARLIYDVAADAAYNFSVKLYTAKQAQAAVLSIGKSRL